MLITPVWHCGYCYKELAVDNYGDPEKMEVRCMTTQCFAHYQKLKLPAEYLQSFKDANLHRSL